MQKSEYTLSDQVLNLYLTTFVKNLYNLLSFFYHKLLELETLSL